MKTTVKTPREIREVRDAMANARALLVARIQAHFDAGHLAPPDVWTSLQAADDVANTLDWVLGDPNIDAILKRACAAVNNK